ncbi:hypothetical protein OIU84_019784 [Salix udensis]|uniref:protein-serine/threonine phosphatase n=1 Tax=Salix udensis TaxID=889485 RepID=A0AAD6PLE6_9ROSI|nr:hypothetical protein OIU84_019784 [Salix udensis]
MRLELQPLKSVTDVAVPPSSTLDITPANRQKVELFPIPLSLDCGNAEGICKTIEDNENHSISNSSKSESVKLEEEAPKFGMTSVRGRRRDMEDAVSIQSSFTTENTSFFGVFDGHGCSHVAMKCRDRLHEIVNEEVEGFKEEKPVEWEETMKRSFIKMDKEVESCCVEGDNSSNCRCELKTPQCDAAGSTAVVAVVTPEKIIVSNCGDSRAVFCRNGVAIPLSSDHKPDRPDELLRIQKAGGRVIYWDGARVLGVLAMSRAIDASILLTKLALARNSSDNVSVVVVDLRRNHQ